jgi:hypothetical protein
MGPAGASPGIGPYIYAYDTTSQAYSATAGTFQDVNFNTNGANSGWTHTAGTATFTCTQAGIFSIDAVTSWFAGSTRMVSMRAVLNGVEIPGSAVTTPIQITGEEQLNFSNVIVSVTVGQVIKIQVACDSNVSVFVDPGNAIAGETPISAGVSITPVNSTGATGATGATGPAGTPGTTNAFTTGGMIVSPKIWVGTGTNDASGNFSIDISSAVFVSVISAQITAIVNSTNAIVGDFGWIRTISTTTVTGTIVHGVTAVIASNTLAVEATARTIHLMVIGN